MKLNHDFMGIEENINIISCASIYRQVYNLQNDAAWFS